jgi:hypothetical protein
LLDELVAHDEVRRQEARRQALEVDPSWLPALVERFERVAASANKPALKELLEKLREHRRAELLDARKAQGTPGVMALPDYLELLVSTRERGSPHLHTLTEVVAYSRMLEKIGSLPAARRLVSVYVRFGEFLRVDTEQALARLGDRSLAALVEATGHPVPRIAAWAEAQLAERGKSRPSDALQVADPALRADVLRAYGRLRRLDALPLLVSYSSSELGLLRTAAREALTAFGEAALWQLREGYEKTVGERAPLDWPGSAWRASCSRASTSSAGPTCSRCMSRGARQSARADRAAACAAFDQALARDPASSWARAWPRRTCAAPASARTRTPRGPSWRRLAPSGSSPLAPCTSAP